MVSEIIDYMGATIGIVLVFMASFFYFSGAVSTGIAGEAQARYRFRSSRVPLRMHSRCEARVTAYELRSTDLEGSF